MPGLQAPEKYAAFSSGQGPTGAKFCHRWERMNTDCKKAVDWLEKVSDEQRQG
jgi:hypothetical protein